MRHRNGQKKTLLEYVASIDRSSTVDPTTGIIRDVLILGSQSANKRFYPPDVLLAAVPLYEDAPVYVDHQSDTSATTSRSYRNKIGRLMNVRFQGGKLRGDLMVNPEHDLAKQLFWDAVNNPSAVGLSHDAVGNVVMQEDGTQIVQKIEEVRSVDLVAEPATTTSLFEEKAMAFRKLNEQAEPAKSEASNNTDPLDALYQSLTLDALQEKRPDLYDALKKQIESELATALGDLKQKLADLQAQLDAYATADQADQEMTEARIFGLIPQSLRNTIRQTKNRDQRARLIEEVKALLNQQSDSAPFGLAAGATARNGGPQYRKTSDEFLARIKEIKS